jgi:hypothetical protein
MHKLTLPSAVLTGLLLLATAAAADESGGLEGKLKLFDSAKLLATAGVSQVEGAGGGGLTNWALITGYGTRDSIGANVHYTYVGLPDYQLHTGGIGLGLFDRVELSYAFQSFDTEKTGGALGLGNGFTFHQQVIGAKVKLSGDAVYDQDSLWPQLAVGMQYKSNDREFAIKAVGGRSANGLDIYLTATKLFLAESLLVDLTLRETKANQFGILGFGGDRHNAYSTEFEGSAALSVLRRLAVGAEYRTKPNNLSFAKEEDAFDVFASYFFSKNFSASVAYVNLGNIAIHSNQAGVYLSLLAGL